MTTAHLLAELRRRGVVLFLEGGTVRYRAPAGALDQDLKQALAERKAEVVAVLAGEAAGDGRPPVGPAPRCAMCTRAKVQLAGRRPRCPVCDGPYLPVGAGGEDQ
jgi:hypothetical protein